MNTPITLQHGETVSTGTVEVVNYSASERRQRALIVFLIGISLSTVSVVVPILHFLLVPLGLVITILLTKNRLKTESIITSGTGTCPACQAPFQIMKRKYHFPFTDVCEKCSRIINIGIGKN